MNLRLNLTREARNSPATSSLLDLRTGEVDAHDGSRRPLCDVRHQGQSEVGVPAPAWAMQNAQGPLCQPRGRLSIPAADGELQLSLSGLTLPFNVLHEEPLVTVSSN